MDLSPEKSMLVANVRSGKEVLCQLRQSRRASEKDNIGMNQRMQWK